MWYVYFLQLSNDHIYVGSTDDLQRRHSSHQAGNVISTKNYLPDAIPAESCYLGWQDSLINLAKLVEPEFNQ